MGEKKPAKVFNSQNGNVSVIRVFLGTGFLVLVNDSIFVRLTMRSPFLKSGFALL